MLASTVAFAALLASLPVSPMPASRPQCRMRDAMRSQSPISIMSESADDADTTVDAAQVVLASLCPEDFSLKVAPAVLECDDLRFSPWTEQMFGVCDPPRGRPAPALRNARRTAERPAACAQALPTGSARANAQHEAPPGARSEATLPGVTAHGSTLPEEPQYQPRAVFPKRLERPPRVPGFSS